MARYAGLFIAFAIGFACGQFAMGLALKPGFYQFHVITPARGPDT